MLAWLLLIFVIPTAGAATLTVNTLDDTNGDDNWCTLREAITAANANSDYYGCTGTGTNYGDDTIRFDVSGTITLTSSLSFSAFSSPQVLTIDGTGQTITISGDNTFPIMVVSSNFQLTLENLQVTKGKPGIMNTGNLTITNSTFSDNHFDTGGAIYNLNGDSLTVTNSTFSNNSATGIGGGALFNYDGSSLTVTNSTFSSNSAGSGGGILNFSGAINITSSIFSENNAGTGGSISNLGTLTVTNSTFSGNRTNGTIVSAGGSIYNTGTLAVTSSTFSNNNAFGAGIPTAGGGISNNQGTLTVTNSTFSGNSSNGYGGGIANGSTLTVINSTFSGNSASAGSGGNLFNSGTLTLKNTILANSPSGGDCASSGGTINASGANLVEDGTTCTIPGNLITADPQLGPLANNGGPTQTMALLPGSPAIDAADNAICDAEPVNHLDQRGVTRPQGTQCDIGAYEFMLTPTTTTLVATPSPAVYGQTVTLTATVSPNTATGTVSFQESGSALTCAEGAQPRALSSGSATCTVTGGFGVGSHAFTADYGGDSTYAASQGTTNLTINKASTTTSTSDNPDPSVVGQTVTVNYAVMVTSPGAGTPTGNVTVSDGTVSCTGTVAAGTCNLTFTSAGTKTLTAAYVGDANFNGSSSSTESHQVLATTAQGDAGGGTVTATITDGTCIGFANSPPPSFSAAPTPLPTSVTFPYGVFGFTAVCPSNGTGTLTLTLTYPKPLPAGTQYWKYGPTPDNTNPHWYVLPATIAGNTITVTLTDGALGDSDLAPNGTIQDPGGPGVSSTTGIPTLSEWALLIFTALFGGLLWQARRRFS